MQMDELFSKCHSCQPIGSPSLVPRPKFSLDVGAVWLIYLATVYF